VGWALGEFLVAGAGDGGGGGGAGGNQNQDGAGGGGSGGAIFLESASIVVGSTGKVCANGGSAGNGNEPNAPGNDGTRGSCEVDRGAVTPGGNQGSAGGVGGFQFAPSGSIGLPTGNPSLGGGGGGGGVGRVRFRGTTDLAVSAAVTPTAQP
jgi:hypothetical protein